MDLPHIAQPDVLALPPCAERFRAYRKAVRQNPPAACTLHRGIGREP